MDVWPRIESLVAAGERVCLVTVVSARGSTPREAGARMIVRADGSFFGTVGGGALEWEALAAARRLIVSESRGAAVRDQALGPDLGQCCGGRVTLILETFGPADAAEIAALAALQRLGPLHVETRQDAAGRFTRRVVAADFGPPRGSALRFIESFGEATDVVMLFGAGHVGRAVVLALAPLPFRVIWSDARAEAFPSAVPARAEPTALDPLEVLRSGPDGAQILIMTHCHALDLDLAAAALAAARFAAVGVIGSRTKKARFVKRLAELGLPGKAIAGLRCPIGAPGISGKEPAVIAASVAAECLMIRSQRLSARPPASAVFSLPRS